MKQNTYPKKDRLRRAGVAGVAALAVAVTGGLAAEQSADRAQDSAAHRLVDHLKRQFSLPNKGGLANVKILKGTIAVQEDGKTVVLFRNPVLTETPKDPADLADDTIIAQENNADGSLDIDTVDLDGEAVQILPDDPENPYASLTVGVTARKGSDGSDGSDGTATYALYRMTERTRDGLVPAYPVVPGTVEVLVSQK